MNNRPLSVLFFSNSLTRGGAEEHMLTLLRGIDRDRFRLTVVCSPEVAELLDPDLPAGCDVVPLLLRRPRHLRAAARLARILRERRVDVLHSHLFYSSVFASPVGRLCRVPAIIETPHVRESWRRGWIKSSYAADRLAGRCVDYYIAVSEANAQYLRDEKRLPAEKIVVVRNGCDPERFRPSDPPAGLRRSLGFDDGDAVLLAAGRLEPQKGHHVLLEAMAAVVREFPRTRLVCIGEGSLRGELERRTGELGLKQHVRWEGFHADVPMWLSIADMSVLPSFYEGLPLAAIESLAAGRPVVATAVDGTPEVVVHGKTGFTVPPGDAGALAAAVCRLLRDPELRRRFARAGRALVLDRFNQQRQVRETEQLYVKAVELRHAAARRNSITIPAVSRGD